MEKFKYLMLLLLSFFLLFFPQAVSAGSGVSEYWHTSICLRVYYSSSYIEDFPSIDIDCAYYDPYDEEEGDEEWEDEWENEKEIEIEPESLESQMERANKEARIVRNTTITGGVMGALPTLIFGALFAGSGEQIYGLLLGVGGGALMGSLSGNVFARVMIAGENNNAPTGCIIGFPLGMFLGALSGATAGGLMFLGAESDPNDWIEVGPGFGIVGGAIVGGILGGITGGIAGASINESLGRRGIVVDDIRGVSIRESLPIEREEANVVQKLSPTGRIKTFVRIPDSTGVKRTLVEVPKPPLSMNRITTEVIVGTLSGYCIGGVCALIRKDDSQLTKDFLWVSSVTIATTMGVYSSGSRNDQTGSFVGTSLVNTIFFGLSYILSYKLLDDKNQDLFKVFSPVVSSIFATFAFNASRRYTRYQGVEVGLLNFEDNRVIIGTPSMYIHSDPFGQKEVAYGVELVKFKF